MRIAIVDDLDTERTLLKERLVRQLSQRGADAEILEFDSGEAFLAAEEAQRFTAAFLDIYLYVYLFFQCSVCSSICALWDIGFPKKSL